MALNCQCDIDLVIKYQGQIYLQFSCMARNTNSSYITKPGPNTDCIHNGSKTKQWTVNKRLTTTTIADNNGLNTTLFGAFSVKIIGLDKQKFQMAKRFTFFPNVFVRT